MRSLCTVIFILAWVIATGLLTDRWQEEQQQRLDESSLVLATTYRASVAMYRLATETLVSEMVQRPEVLSTFAKGVENTGPARDAARGRLYRLLAPTYAHLKNHDIRQFQFHTPAGFSFLRFHAPEKSGDLLANIRPAIQLVNQEKRPIFGFELGRLVSGFRYIYPLFLGDQHLGSVETTLTFNSIRNAMDDIAPGREYQLVLRKEAIDRVMFKEPRLLYVPSLINDAFLVEDHRLQLPVSPFPPSPAIQALAGQLKHDATVHEKMAAAEPFALAATVKDVNWVVSFFPVADIAGNNVAYVISYARAPFLTGLRYEYFLNMILATLAIGGLYWLSLRLLNAHAVLQREKRHLQTITDTIADGLYVMDQQGRIVMINPAFSEILGYQADETIGKIGHYLFHIHEDGHDLPLEECPIIAATRRGTEYADEALFRHKNGQQLTVELSCKPITQQAFITGSVTAFRDISERKAAQQRLLESDRIKSEFIATASHELRTPLAVIQGYIELLLEDKGLSCEQTEEFEEIVYEKAIALEKIIDDLLDVSRIETGRPICLDLETVEITEQLAKIVEHFKKESKEHCITLSLPSEKVLLSLDRFKFNQALENLLTNAIKFSPDGGEIQVQGRVINAQLLELRISDQGVGIEPEQQPFIFEKFFRVDNSNTAVSGFGLGLYLVKRIIEAHQGSVRVESEPGKGASFIVTLPICQGTTATES